MSQPKNKKPNISLASLGYYFDQVERDRLDALGTSGRSKEIMDLRNQLLSVPEHRFAATIEAIQSMVASAVTLPKDSKKGRTNTGAPDVTPNQKSELNLMTLEAASPSTRGSASSTKGAGKVSPT